MKFYLIKAFTLSAVLFGLWSIQPTYAKASNVTVDLAWVNQQVDTVCPIGDDIPASCSDEVDLCRKGSVSAIYSKVNLEQCAWEKGFAFSCDPTQIKAIFAYVKDVLQGNAWGHPESVDTAKSCVKSAKTAGTFPQGQPNPKEEYVDITSAKLKEITGTFCETPAGTGSEACKTAADQCHVEAEAAYAQALSDVLYNHPKGCVYVEDPNGAHYSCTTDTLHLITTDLADIDSKENFGKDISTACTNIKMGDGIDIPQPPAGFGVPTGGTDTNAANADTQSTGANVGMGGWGCTLNANETSATSPSFALTVLALALSTSLLLGKRKSN